MIGTDPEVFLFDADTEKYISAIGLVGGTKKHPRKVKKGAVQEDNVLAEYNIDPASNNQEFLENIRTVEEELQKIVGKLELHKVSSVHMPEDQLAHPLAKVFGCESDWNAWDMGVNPAPASSSAPRLRTASGHVHLDITDDSPMAKVNVVRLFDYRVALPLTALDPDKERRTLYGRAGDFRNTKYGVECRVPSNYWLRSDELILWMWEEARFCSTISPSHVEMYLNSYMGNLPPDSMRHIVNTGDNEAATSMCNALQLHIPKGA